MAKILIYLAIGTLAFLGASFLGFWSMIHPPKFKFEQQPANFNLPAEEIYISTEDNIKLSAWLIESEAANKKAVILMHGYPAEKSEMLFIASKLYPDFTTLLLDLRYFGKSEGSSTSLGLKERKDLSAVLDLLEHKGYEKIGIFGYSLGGAIGLMAAVEDQRINAVSTYAAFSDYKTIGEETYSFLWILKKPLVALMMFWGELAFKESLTKTTPLNAAKTLTIPTLIIHNRTDDQIPFNHAKALQQALKNNPQAEFYFSDTGLHNEPPLDFEARIKDFFKANL